jgi:mono/diheme cytochrome c family protein
LSANSERVLMKPKIRLAALLTLSVVASHAHAQVVGDPQKGLGLAQQVCSECHAVRIGEVRSPNSKAPTFLELATTPGMTSTALLVALTTPHAGMPMFRLTVEQRKDVIAYVLSLR